MPYVITTHRHLDDPTAEFLPGAAPGVTRRAVATLEEGCAPYALPPEGRDETLQERTDRATTYDAIRLGAPSTRLIDGTVIEVEEMSNAFGRPDARGYLQERGWHLPASLDDAEILDAYNAAQ